MAEYKNVSNDSLDPIYKDNDITKPSTYPQRQDKMSEIVEFIKDQLGGQVLDLELNDEQIKKIVEQSFKQIIHYISDLYTLHTTYNNCIDLSKYNVDNVQYVLRGQDNISVGLPFELPYLTLLNNNGSSNINLDNYMNALTVKRNMNYLSTDLDFVWDKPNQKLYITANPVKPSSIVIVFKPQYNKVEDIKEDYWITQLQEMSLARTKIILGRIRSKYTSSSTKFSLDGQTLLQEGNADLAAIKQRLDDNKDIFTVLN